MTTMNMNINEFDENDIHVGRPQWNATTHTMTLGGFEYVEQIYKSTKYRDAVIIDVFGYDMDNLPQDIKNLKLQGKIIYNQAVEKAQYLIDQGQMTSIKYKGFYTKKFRKVLNKKRWEMIFGKPSRYVVVSSAITNEQLGYIKAALTYGVTVEVYDMHFRTYDIIDPVCNKHNHILFKKFTIENVTLAEALEHNNWNLVDIKINSAIVLEAARHAAMVNIWPEVEDALKPVKDRYYKERLDQSAEFDLFGENYQIMFDVLRDFEDEALLEADPMAYIREYLRIWSGYYGMDVQYNELQPDDTTYKMDLRSAFFTTHKIPLTAESMDKQYSRNGYAVRNRFYGTDTMENLIKDYMHIQYLRAMEIEGLPEYKLCKACGKPVYRTAEECNHCGETAAQSLSPFVVEVLQHCANNSSRHEALGRLKMSGYYTTEDLEEALETLENLKKQFGK